MTYQNEKQATQATVAAGNQYGYGNMIHRLQMAWVLYLWERGQSWESAALGALLPRNKITRIIRAAEKDEQALIQKLKADTEQL